MRILLSWFVLVVAGVRGQEAGGSTYTEEGCPIEQVSFELITGSGKTKMKNWRTKLGRVEKKLMVDINCFKMIRHLIYQI